MSGAREARMRWAASAIRDGGGAPQTVARANGIALT